MIKTLLTFLIVGIVICMVGCGKQVDENKHCYLCDVDSVIGHRLYWIHGTRQICDVTQEYIDTNSNVYYPDSLRRVWKCQIME